jgi:hypothetical protein
MMKKLLSVLLRLFLFMLIIVLASVFFILKNSAERREFPKTVPRWSDVPATPKVEDITFSDLEPHLHRISEQINNKLPIQIDGETRLEHVRMNRDHTITYHHILSTLLASDPLIPTLTAPLRAKIISDMKTNPHRNFFMKNRISLIYEYYDRAGSKALAIKIEPEELEGE